jgi:flagellar biosynthesis component FlhA
MWCAVAHHISQLIGGLCSRTRGLERMISAKELIVPLGFVGTVGCMLLPLPAVALDVLQCSNLLFALLLVIGALHIKDPLKIAALPSLLLMATLFRLSLNLATTRAVLGTGHAGKAVEAFGSVVIQGNLVVGFVLFLLITLIQFIVVAKGAERVAEVAARFTLDAMPGKQMAIDAEIRSGILDPETARRKRSDVQSESRFYGALDGAMKFVKGDAIAGLVVTFVNICGGLLVGVFIHELDVGVAVRRYTVLTIGDGLLSQIPSLLNSIAAGLVVTRVQVDEVSTLSSDLLSQLAQFTAARAFVGCAAFLLGCLPGMPHLALFIVSLLIFVSLFMKPKASGSAQDAPFESFEPRLPQALHIEISKEVAAHLPAVGAVMQGLEGFREYAFTKWGLVLQRPTLELWDGAAAGYRIMVRGMEVFRRDETGGEQTWDALLAHVRRVVDEYRVELIDDGASRRALDYVERQVPELVTGATPAVLSLTQITGLLRSLLREGVTTRHIDIVLQTIAEHGSGTSDRSLLVEVRSALAPVVSNSVATDGVISGVALGPLLDLTLARAEENGSLIAGEVVDLIHDRATRMVSEGAVLVCSKRSRAYLRDILWIRGARIPVLAHEEIAQHVRLVVMGEIDVEGDAERTALLGGLTV